MIDKLKIARDHLIRDSKKYEDLTYVDGVLDMFNEICKIHAGTWIKPKTFLDKFGRKNEAQV